MKETKNEKPVVFEYDNYRDYLGDYYDFEKTQKAFFSHRYFLKKAGYRTTSMLRMVMQGKRNLNDDGIRKFIKAMQLDQSESTFFKQLVKFNQACTAEEKQRFAKEIVRSKVYSRLKPLASASFYYWSHWYNVAIRELVDLTHFREDHQWIAQTIVPNITPQQAWESISSLLQLGFLKRNAKGKLVQSDGNVTSGDRVVGTGVNRFHHEMIQKARESINRFEQNERQISTITFGLSEKSAKKAKEMIDTFRKDLLALANEEKDPNRVFQTNFQFFPLSKFVNPEFVEKDDE